MQTRRAARWHFTITLGAVGLAILGAVGCGGDRKGQTYRPPIESDAGADATGDAKGPGNDAGQPGSDGGSDAGSGSDGPAAPVTGPGGRRIVQGRASLISKGPACTNEAGSAEDTWCAILRPSTFNQGGEALFVVNVTQAMAGVPISCGSPAGDPNCLMLTSGFAEDDTHKTGFAGRTLIYFDQTATPYGWRPGMVNGRRLVVVTTETGNAHDCTAAVKGDLVACLQDIPTPIVPGAGLPGTGAPVTAQYSNLLVGHVGTGSALLPVLDTVVSSDNNDSAQRFQYRFVGATGDRIAWSTRETRGGPEVLKTQIVGADDSRQVVASDVSRWSVSPDGSRWTWLSQFNYDSSAPSGILQTAAFPTGAGPVKILEDTAAFSFVGSRGLAVLGKDGQLYGVSDLGAGAMTQLTTLDSSVLGVVATSSAGFLAYAKQYDFVFGLIDLYVTHLDGRTPCSLNRRDEVPFGSSMGPRFLPSGAALLWGRVTNLDTTDDRLIAAGKFTRTADCATQTVESDLVSLGPLGDEGILISDSYDGTGGTLRIVGLTPDGQLVPGQSTLVQTRMNSSLSLYPYLRALLYTVDVGDPADGLYLRPLSAAN